MNSADFPGRSTSKLDPVLIFDLDGTILSVNSYRVWVMHLLRGHFGGMKLTERAILSITAARVLLASKLFAWAHTRTKQMMQRLWTEALACDVHEEALGLLVRSLVRRVRPNCMSLLTHVSRGETMAVLSTAAAGEYAYATGEQLGFRHVLATSKCNEAVWLDNSGDEKRRRTLAYLTKHAWHDRKRVFLTDHNSDLPLLRACQLALWFGNERELNAIRRAAPGTQVLQCKDLSDAQVMAIILGQYQEGQSCIINA